MCETLDNDWRQGQRWPAGPVSAYIRAIRGSQYSESAAALLPRRTELLHDAKKSAVIPGYSSRERRDPRGNGRVATAQPMQPEECRNVREVQVIRGAAARLAMAVIVSGGVMSAWFNAHAQAPQRDAAAAVEMGNHYSLALAMHTAVARGDLSAIALNAQALAQYPEPPGASERTSKYAATIRRTAGDIAAAPDVLTAATATALLLNVCGQCHQAVGTRPSLPLRSEPELGGVVGHMLAHRRAADQMFQGLVSPSNALWRDGARAFATAPLHAGDLPVNSAGRKQMIQTEERMHRLATDAAQATDLRARANFYGQLLAGCADCHRHSPRWGPPVELDR